MKFFQQLQPPGAYIESLQLLRGTWENKSATVAVILQFFLSSSVLAIYWKNLPPKVPLWYSKPWGEERLALPIFLFLIPITAICIYELNRMLLTKIASDHPLFGRVLSLVSLLISILSSIIVIRIVTLVT